MSSTTVAPAVYSFGDLAPIAAALAPVALATVDDLAAPLAAFGTRLHVGQGEHPSVVSSFQTLTRWGGFPAVDDVPLHLAGADVVEGRSFRLTLGVGGARLRCFDANRVERAATAARERVARDVALRAGLWASGDVDALEALDTATGRCVVEWSRRSRSRMVEAFANLDYRPMLREGTTPGMVTVSYPGDWLAVAPSGPVAKRHLDNLRRAWTHAFGWSPVGLWKMEFQGRGAPHFHSYLPVPVHGPDGEPFVVWLARTWARIVGACETCETCGARSDRCGDWRCIVCTGVRCCVAPSSERIRNRHAGTGVDFGAASRFLDPRRLALYFLGHSTKGPDGKEYQHQVPEQWQEPGKGPGRFWGFWGLDRAQVDVDLSWREFCHLRRVMRRVARARSVVTAMDVRRHACVRDPGHRPECRCYLSVRPPRRWTLGSGGALTGGFVLVNDGVRLALDLARCARAVAAGMAGSPERARAVPLGP